MPYPTGHRERVRVRIVESARRLFNRHGFDGVSVDTIMAHAGLTRGGFYTYFSSKSDLYVEALSCFFTDPNWKNGWKRVSVDLTSEDAAPEIVRAYLSQQHLEAVDNSCPMVALPSDVARSNSAVKAAFETVFKAMVKLLSQNIRGKNQAPNDQGMAIAALCIGGMVVARSMNDRSLAKQLRQASIRAALELGGWASTTGTATTRNNKAKRSKAPKRTRIGAGERVPT